MSICITLDTEQGRIAVNLANGQALVYAPDSVIELGDGVAWSPSPVTYTLGLIEVPIAGIESTGAVGGVQPGLSAGLAGVAATGAVDAFGVTTSVALTGSSATGAVGTVGAAIDIAATGVEATSAVGSPGTGLGLTGSTATGEVGTLGSTAIKSGVVIWGRFSASRSVGKTATQGTITFRRAA